VGHDLDLKERRGRGQVDHVEDQPGETFVEDLFQAAQSRLSAGAGRFRGEEDGQVYVAVGAGAGVRTRAEQARETHAGFLAQRFSQESR
jgi:hypothetical protein